MFYRFIASAVVIFLCSFVPHARVLGQVVFNPQVGFSASALSTDPGDLRSSARFGYQIGASLRFGDNVHVQPGLFWQRSGTELRGERPTVEELLNEDVDIDAILGTLLIGYNLFDTVPLTIRVNGGLAGTAIVDVQDGEFDDLVDYNTLLVGLPIGVGADILDFLSVDASYEFGLTSLFDEVFGLNVDVTNNVFRFNVGLIF